MTVAPEQAVVDAIEIAVALAPTDTTFTAIGDLSLGENLFLGPRRVETRSGGPGFKVPGRSVFCLETGGGSPISCVNANEGPDIRDSSVQVMVRSLPGEYQTGKQTADALWKALQRAEIDGYMSITCRESAPIYLGMDDTENHEWTINIDTRRED